MIITRKRHHEVVDGYEKQIAALRLDAEELEEENLALRMRLVFAKQQVEDAEKAVAEAKHAGDAAVEVALKAYEKATS